MDWRSISIDGKIGTFLLSIVNESDDNYTVNLTDFKSLWTEKLAWKCILDRAQSENPIMNVGAEETTIERTIFSPAKNYQCNSNNTDTEMMLKIKYYIGGVPFHFKWNLTKSGAEMFYEQITRKLLVTLLNVQDQRTELLDIVKRKDAEINQYKVEGAALSRTQMATQPFLKSEFDGKFELMSDSSLFVAVDNCNTIKKMCNYGDLIKGSSALTSDVPARPSPSKIFKPQKNKEENAMRKFKAKRECKIQYESSFELLISDEEMPLDGNTKSERDNRTADATANSLKDERKQIPKRKLKSKLNL